MAEYAKFIIFGLGLGMLLVSKPAAKFHVKMSRKLYGWLIKSDSYWEGYRKLFRFAWIFLGVLMLIVNGARILI